MCENALTIDTSRITGDPGSVLLRPYDSEQTVSELLDGLYFDLSVYLQPMGYGKDWALRNAKTQELLTSMGRRWAQRRGAPRDRRSLSEVGFRAGMRLEAIRL